MKDDKFYDDVAREILEKRLASGVWARAFAEAEGDSEKAKALYIRHRVAQLVEEDRLQQEQAEELLRQRRTQEERERKEKLAAQSEKNRPEIEASVLFWGFIGVIILTFLVIYFWYRPS
jgi:hypothetical protein